MKRLHRNPMVVDNVMPAVREIFRALVQMAKADSGELVIRTQNDFGDKTDPRKYGFGIMVEFETSETFLIPRNLAATRQSFFGVPGLNVSYVAVWHLNDFGQFAMRQSEFFKDFKGRLLFTVTAQ